MAGLNGPFRSPGSISYAHSTFIWRLLVLLTVLPLLLAVFAFLLQWRGGLDDPSSRWAVAEERGFLGMGDSPLSLGNSSPVAMSLLSTTVVDCAEILGGSSSPSFPYYRGWKFDLDAEPRPKICITSSTSAGLEQILPWLFYHKSIGVTAFFLFVEGKAAEPSVSEVLVSIPGVKVIYRDRELEEKQAKSRIWNETWLAGFFYKPCNYELFVKQSLNMEMAISIARDAGMEWIIHLDTDELVHPAGAQEYSLRRLLSDIPDNVDMVIFPNYESSIERDDIKDPFSEVSMFKKNYDHLPKDTYFSMYKEATRGNPNYFLTYGNGKSAARVQDHLRPNGAHRWHNYMKPPNEIKLEEAAVLHYTYTKFSDLTSRRDRCGCKPTKDDVKRCFMLEFDRNAFIIASTATEDEMLQWFHEHVVWTNKQLNLKLLKKGILTRINAPMAIIQSLKAAGIFTSAIASAQNKNSSVQATSVQSKTSGTITSVESRIFHRKVLQISETIEAAPPPLSPPGLHELDI
ncbi:hypothetical protein KSP40_PGU013632 [Platanthera guangdongensis]|uniref:Glycosyltransferase family 92 protein n=1 Tax=Platanthera guangdongensis TaxID=2320717 RepID=A0ABR2M5F4_9ASPA